MKPGHIYQGYGLTAWIERGRIPIFNSDNMAGYFMYKGEINCCITGADRIALNGDTANKIGTYSIVVLAHENKIPFLYCSPNLTIDFSIKGKEIPIEEET